MNHIYSMVSTIEYTPDEVITKLREMTERVRREKEFYGMSNFILEVGESAFHQIVGELPYIDQRRRTIFDIPFIVKDPTFISPYQIRLVSDDRERIDYTKMFNKLKSFRECNLKEANKVFIRGEFSNPVLAARAEIKNVIFNNPATIVVWDDGTKTVVKAENEPFDPEKGLAMCIVKKALGNKGNYYDIFRKWLPKE